MPRKSTKTVSETLNAEAWDEIDNEVSENDDINISEMVSMIKEYEKRKASKTSSRSTAFDDKKIALFKEARTDADSMLKDGIAQIEGFRAQVTDMKGQQLARNPYMNDITRVSQSQDDLTRVPAGLYQSVFRELSIHRAEEINETSAILEAHSSERQSSRRRLMKSVKGRLDESLEHQQIATDARALIQHYKSLLRL